MFLTSICLSFSLFFFSLDSTDKSDQSTAASWWTQPHITPAGGSVPGDSSNYFQATHGLVQTHPALSSGIPRPGSAPLGRPISSSAATPITPITGTVVQPNPKSPFRHLDFATSATAELRRNPSLSAPDECARACREGEPPRICYYHFTLEYYTVLGA